MSELVDLNVGGKEFTTWRSTLEKAGPDSFFARLLNGAFAIPRDKENRVFLDRNPEYFAVVLDLLRCEEAISCPPGLDAGRLARELDYYGVPRVTPRSGPSCSLSDAVMIDLIERDDVRRAAQRTLQREAFLRKFQNEVSCVEKAVFSGLRASIEATESRDRIAALVLPSRKRFDLSGNSFFHKWLEQAKHTWIERKVGTAQWAYGYGAAREPPSPFDEGRMREQSMKECPQPSATIPDEQVPPGGVFDDEACSALLTIEAFADQLPGHFLERHNLTVRVEPWVATACADIDLRVRWVFLPEPQATVALRGATKIWTLTFVAIVWETSPPPDTFKAPEAVEEEGGSETGDK